MIVPLLSLVGTRTAPVGVFDPAGVVLEDGSVDVSVSRELGLLLLEAAEASTSIDSSWEVVNDDIEGIRKRRTSRVWEPCSTVRGAPSWAT